MENPAEADGLQKNIDQEAAILRVAVHGIDIRPGNANIDYDIEEDDLVTTLECKGGDGESSESNDESNHCSYEYFDDDRGSFSSKESSWSEEPFNSADEVRPDEGGELADDEDANDALPLSGRTSLPELNVSAIQQESFLMTDSPSSEN